MSSDDIGRASKARWIWVSAGSEALIGGGRGGRERNPPV